jgi:hypothetical protein
MARAKASSTSLPMSVSRMRRTGSAAITARADKETTISASKNERDMEFRLTENTVACRGFLFVPARIEPIRVKRIRASE